MNTQDLYSYHVFLFTFQWHYTGKDYRSATFEDQTSLDAFERELEHTNWKRTSLGIDRVLYFNERNYFYDFVRDILYDKKENVHNGKGIRQTDFIAHYQYDIPADTLFYTITLSNDTQYKLHVDSILLHLYNTGVGVLSFHLNNRISEQASEDDILLINQYGRRISPPFFSMDNALIGSQEQFRYADFKSALGRTKQLELAHSIQLGNWPAEDWIAYAGEVEINGYHFDLPLFIRDLFPTVPLTTNVQAKDTDEFAIYLEPSTDDRMFVLCWYGNDTIVNRYCVDTTGNFDKKALRDDEGRFNYLTDEWLYKYIFVDSKFAACQNDDLLTQLIAAHSNARWVNYGTIYGVSRYSFVCLTSALESMRGGPAFLVNHMQTMYYKMVELCLVQRSCILRFADEVTSISSMIKQDEKNLSDRVSSLYKQYIRFVNKIYFREVTAQEQGIELYDLLQEKMRIRKDVDDLDKEIEELHNYVHLMEEQKRNENLNILTVLGAAFVVPTFVSGIFGMTAFEGSISIFPDLVKIILVLGISPAVIILYLFLTGRRNAKLWILLILSIVSSAISILLLQYLFQYT